MDVDPTVEEEEVAEAVKSCLREELSGCKDVPDEEALQRTRKAFVRLEEAQDLTLLKATHIKIG